MKVAIKARLLAKRNVDVDTSPSQPPQRGGTVTVVFEFLFGQYDFIRIATNFSFCVDPQ